MATGWCILNLSDPGLKLDTGSLSFGYSLIPNVIDGWSDDGRVPKSLKDAMGKPKSLILYIVGHAFPNVVALRKPARLKGAKPPAPSLLVERDLAHAVKRARGNGKTLIIWDLCFARSFLRIPKFSWGDQFAHIFSCQAHERTWRMGPAARQKASRKRGTVLSGQRTRFSFELERALCTLRDNGRKVPAITWLSLQKQLQLQLCPIQTPEVVSFGPRPDDFGLNAVGR